MCKGDLCMKLLLSMTIFIQLCFTSNIGKIDQTSYLLKMLKQTDLYHQHVNYHLIGPIDLIKDYDIPIRSIYAIHDDQEYIGFIIEDIYGNYNIGEYYAEELNSLIDTKSDFKLSYIDDRITVMQEDLNIDLAYGVKTSINEKGQQTRDYGDEIGLIPFKHMSSINECWAACMASIVEFKTSSPKNISEVKADLNKYDMASINQVSNFLSNEYGIANSLNYGSLSFNQTMNNIGNNRPMIAGCKQVNGNVDHMVVIKGAYYLTSGQHDAMYKIMDPYNYSEINVITDSDQILSFISYGGYSFQWQNAIVIY